MIDLSILEIETGATLTKSTQFKIETRYTGSGDTPRVIQILASLNGGVSYTLLNTAYLEVPAGQQSFHLKVRVSETHTESLDNELILTIRPTSNILGFTNAAEGVEVRIPYQIRERVSSLTLANTQTVIDNKQLCTITLDIAPSLMYDTRVHIDTSTSHTGVTISDCQYSFDGLEFKDAPSDGVIDPPIGADKLYYRFKPSSELNPPGSVTLKIAEVGITQRLQGLPLTVPFTINTPGQNLPKDTLIKIYCDGYNKTAELADGNGGKYTKILQANSRECGYKPPVAGTVLKTYCANYNQYRQVADGNDGYTVELVNQNDATNCSYTAPTLKTNADFTPAELVGFGTRIISNAKLGLAARRRDGARADYSAMHSKWYWEIRIDKALSEHALMAFGIATDAFNTANWLGSDDQSWGIWPFNNTKHHSDIQQDCNLSLVKGDVVSLLLDTDARALSVWVNGVDKGVVFRNLPEYTKFYPILNAEKDSYALANFGQYEFKYTPPSGYIAGFGRLKDEPKERGVEIRRYCQGSQKVAECHDGRRGKYATVINDRDPDCGFNPPKGTIIRTECVGTDLYHIVADGNGGEDKVLFASNSLSCGYVPPSITPTKLKAYPEDNSAQYQTKLNADKVSGLVYEPAITEFSIYSGKWYWEYSVSSVATSVGIMASSLASELGLKKDQPNHTVKALAELALAQSSKARVWCLDLSTRRVMHNGKFEYYSYEIAAGDTLGFSIDFKEQTLKISINGEYKPDLVFTNLPSEFDYLATVSSSDNAAQPFKFNFGAESFKHAPVSADYTLGVGQTTPIYARKGTIASHYCTGYTKYNRVNDGFGGTTAAKVADNHRDCGYVPPTPRGTLDSKVCRGYDQYAKYHDGNYGFYEELIEEKSTSCGFYPKDALVSSRCSGFNKIGTYSNGDVPQTTYEKVIEKNSVECGYVKQNNYPRPDRSRIDPNLPATQNAELKVKVYPIPSSDSQLSIDRKL